jgi:hypothetical protein
MSESATFLIIAPNGQVLRITTFCLYPELQQAMGNVKRHSIWRGKTRLSADLFRRLKACLHNAGEKPASTVIVITVDEESILTGN